MGSVFGQFLKLSVFGESHGEGIGCVLDSFPAGFTPDMDFISACMARRAPGGTLSTKRKEPDIPEIVSGLFNGTTTGAPICVLIRNTDTRSHDYGEGMVKPRPSHADYAAWVKYKGYSDYRGGGHFSGRLTAPIVFAGALCLDYLRTVHSVNVGAHLLKIKDATDTPFDALRVDGELFDALRDKQISTIDDKASYAMSVVIEKARLDCDSIGGIIECAAVGLPVGLGEHMYSSAESIISQTMFAIPGVKGIQFGAGFSFADMSGTTANDAMYADGDKTYFSSNNCGGIQGGMTNGAPVIFSVAMKPTPSIFLEQDTVNLKTMSSDKLLINGRHDPCIALRAVPVVEASCALALMELFLASGHVGR